MSDSPGKGQGGAGSKTEKTLGDFAAEYAKSNRSTCKGCLEKIDKVRVRLRHRTRGSFHWVSLTSLTTLSCLLSLKKDSRLGTPPGRLWKHRGARTGCALPVTLPDLMQILHLITVLGIWRWAVGFRKENHDIIKRSPATFNHYKMGQKFRF